MGPRIGSGQMGSVFRGVYMHAASAVKQVALPLSPATRQRCIQRLLKEIMVLAELRHPHTVRQP
jgi:hypothetical protein